MQQQQCTNKDGVYTSFQTGTCIHHHGMQHSLCIEHKGLPSIPKTEGIRKTASQGKSCPDFAFAAVAVRQKKPTLHAQACTTASQWKVQISQGCTNTCLHSLCPSWCTTNCWLAMQACPRSTCTCTAHAAHVRMAGAAGRLSSSSAACCGAAGSSGSSGSCSSSGSMGTLKCCKWLQLTTRWAAGYTQSWHLTSAVWAMMALNGPTDAPGCSVRLATHKGCKQVAACCCVVCNCHTASTIVW